MNPPRSFHCPKDIIWGRGSLAYLENIRAKRVLIVTDKGMVNLGLIDRAKEYFLKGGAEVRVFDEVEPEPSINTVMRMVTENKAFNPDVIVGIGGGSPIDASKAFRIFVEYPKLTFADVRFLDSPPRKAIPPFKKTIHITVSSSSGTGSDVSYAALITDPSIPAKCPIFSLEIIPTMAIVDPDMADSMPPELLADAGLDALTHGIESYVNIRANDFSRGNSLQAITLIMQYLLPSFLGKDPAAKEHMHYAATIAGIAFSNSANGICHTIADKMGATFKLTHGRANAIALPFVIKFNGIVVGKDFLHMARAIGFDGQNPDQAVNYLIQRVNTLKRQLHVQDSYKDAGISEDIFAAKLPDLVKRASVFPATALNPRKPSTEEMEALFKACYHGDYSLI